MKSIEYIGSVNCDCPISYMGEVWNEEKGRYELTCLKCRTKATYYKSTEKKSDGSHTKKRRGSRLSDDDPTNTYKVPRGYQNWHAGYGYRRSFKETKTK